MIKSKRLFLVSIFTILISMAMLISVTFAWFTSTISTKVPSIKSSVYSLSYEIETNGANSNVSKTLINADSDNDKYYDATYNVVDNITSIAINLSATGTANASGYCVVKIGDNTYYTNTITSGNNYSFTITTPKYSFSSGTKITLISKWGKLPTTIDSNQVIPNESNGGNNGISLSSLDEETPENITTPSNGNETENNINDVGTPQVNGETDATATPVQEQNNGEGTQTDTQETETKDNTSTTDIGNNNNGGSINETGNTNGSTEKVEETVDNVDTSTADNTQEVNQ